MSCRLSRFEPSLRPPYTRYANDRFEPPQPAKPPHPLVSRDPIIYMHIFAGENDDVVTRTCAPEKIRLDFFRAEPLYVLYIAGKNVKNCKVRSCLCALDPSIFHFI